MLDYECKDILSECYHGVSGGHFGGKATTRKILKAGLWWPTVFKDAQDYMKSCYVCKWLGKPSRRHELLLHPVRELQPFEKWAVSFSGLTTCCLPALAVQPVPRND